MYTSARWCIQILTYIMFALTYQAVTFAQHVIKFFPRSSSIEIWQAHVLNQIE